jgi:hypothetical protein
MPPRSYNTRREAHFSSGLTNLNTRKGDQPLKGSDRRSVNPSRSIANMSGSERGAFNLAAAKHNRELQEAQQRRQSAESCPEGPTARWVYAHPDHMEDEARRYWRDAHQMDREDALAWFQSLEARRKAWWSSEERSRTDSQWVRTFPRHMQGEVRESIHVWEKRGPIYEIRKTTREHIDLEARRDEYWAEKLREISGAKSSSQWIDGHPFHLRNKAIEIVNKAKSWGLEKTRQEYQALTEEKEKWWAMHTSPDIYRRFATLPHSQPETRKRQAEQKDCQKRLEESEAGIEEISERVNDELESLAFKQQDCEIYWRIMSSEDKEKFQRSLALAEEESNKYLDPNSFSENMSSEKTKVFINLRRANTKLSKIIEAQKTPEKLQKGLDDQLCLADQLLPKAQSAQRTLDVRMSTKSIEQLIRTRHLSEVNQDNLSDAIKVFETLAIANNTLEPIVQQSSETSSSAQTQKENAEQSLDPNLEGVRQSFESIKKVSKFETAKQNFNSFKDTFNAFSHESDAGDFEALHFFMTTDYRGFLGIFSGLKPCMLIPKRGFKDKYIEILRKYSRGDIDVIDTNPQNDPSLDVAYIVVSERNFRRLLSSPYGKYFPKYEFGSDMFSYVKRLNLDNPFSHENSDFGLDLLTVQRGLSFGYEPHSVIQYVDYGHTRVGLYFEYEEKYNNIRKIERNLGITNIEDSDDISRDERKYVIAVKFFHSDSAFRDKYKDEMLAYLTDYHSDIPEAARKYAVAERPPIEEGAFGMASLSDPTSDESKRFREDITVAFDYSGMSKFIAESYSYPPTHRGMILP